MQDLLLWRSLQRTNLDAERVLPLLEQAAARPLRERLPYLGSLAPALGHEDGALRAAAIRLLSGSSGGLGFQAIVAALDDADERVRVAAVEALRASAADDPPRWAHALFHPEATVRRAAIGGEPVRSVEWLDFFLLADDECRRSLPDRLQKLSPPARLLPLLFDLHERGQLSADAARRYLARMNVAETLAWAGLQARDAAEVDLLLSPFTPADRDRLAAVESEDSLDRLFALFWEPQDDQADPGPSGAVGEATLGGPDEEATLGGPDEEATLGGPDEEATRGGPDEEATVGGPEENTPVGGLEAVGPVEPDPYEVFFAAWRKGLAAHSRRSGGLARRVALSLLVLAARHRYVPPAALGLAVIGHPESLTYEWIPRPLRQRAVAVFYELGCRCPKVAAARVRRLLTTDLCRRPSGHLDLDTVGAILHLLDRHPFLKAQTWLGTARIIAAFLAEPDSAMPFFLLADDSERGRPYLIRTILEARPQLGARLLALLVLASPADRLDFLAALDPASAVELFTHLCGLSESDGSRMSARKLEAVGRALAVRLLEPTAVRMARRKPAARRRDAESQTEPIASFLDAWLDRPTPERLGLGVEILTVLARELEVETLGSRFLKLEPSRLRRLLRTVDHCPGFPYAKESALGTLLADHADEAVRTWAAERGFRPAPPPPARRSTRRRPVSKLSHTETREIAETPLPGLERAIEPCLAEPRVGLCAALARRETPAVPRLSVCLALLASHDPPLEVDTQFARFGSRHPSFLARLDRAMVEHWRGERRLPLLGNAWLHRWDPHCFAFGEDIGAWEGGLTRLLELGRSLGEQVLTGQVWQAAARLLAMLRYRDPDRLRRLVDTATLPPVLVEGLGAPAAEAAAGMLVTMYRAAEIEPSFAKALEAVQPAVAASLPELDPEVRRRLRRWIDDRGLATLPASRRSARSPVDHAQVARIRASADLDELIARAAGAELALAEEAALRLVELVGSSRGAPGREAGALARLCRLILAEPAVPCVVALASTVSLWPACHELETIRTWVESPANDPEVRFVLGVGLWERAEEDLLPHLLDAACRPAPTSWFGRADWEKLLALGAEERALAPALAVSPQPGAYVPAVSWLAARAQPDDAVARALVAFLEAGDDRLLALRRQAAARLHDTGCRDGFPVLLEAWVGDEGGDEGSPGLLSGVPGELVEATVEAVLVAGRGVVKEDRLLELLGAKGVDEEARERAYRRILSLASSARLRSGVVARLRPARSRSDKLARVAHSFAWGVRMGRELTGRRMAVRMIAGEELGYTRLHENSVYVNPLPILRRERYGEEVVEALILHELGHHRYHSGETGEAVWKQAENEGIFPLLNLVADEHLERNLRSLDRSFGNRLKRLAAYAFQHARNEVEVESLLDALGGRAVEVLGRARLLVARRRGCVAVEGGRVLLEMERAGLGFARFVRALRMGLGNRHRDPLVSDALRLFDGRFRRAGMQELLRVAQRLREIFGWQVRLLRCLGQDAVLRGEEGDRLADGEGITDEELEAEVRRILDPRTLPRGGGSGSGGRYLNVNPSEEFATISDVVPLLHDPEAHQQYAGQVQRQARQMRRYLRQLGLAYEPQRYRVRGHRLDPGRTRAALTHGDPRALVSRQLRQRVDLFLGLLVDCSGSMQVKAHIERAKLFATMLAEAAKGEPGIELRLFGFTDAVIYDAGTASRCAAHALEAEGGNNDAAALWHAALVARASQRRAKLLVMISDGLPTECSAAALRSLVKRLGHRQRICCAQVAVQPLAEICFPHYVELNGEEADRSVRRFGTVVARLVQRTLAAG